MIQNVIILVFTALASSFLWFLFEFGFRQKRAARIEPVGQAGKKASHLPKQPELFPSKLLEAISDRLTASQGRKANNRRGTKSVSSVSSKRSGREQRSKE